MIRSKILRIRKEEKKLKWGSTETVRPVVTMFDIKIDVEWLESDKNEKNEKLWSDYGGYIDWYWLVYGILIILSKWSRKRIER